MQIHVTENPENLLVEIEGSLDASSSIQLDDFFKEHVDNGICRYLINCNNLEYISSAGLGVFISYLDDITAKNGYLVFYGLSPTVNNVFDILGLSQILPIKKDLQEAESYIKQNFS